MGLIVTVMKKFMAIVTITAVVACAALVPTKVSKLKEERITTATIVIRPIFCGKNLNGKVGV